MDKAEYKNLKQMKKAVNGKFYQFPNMGVTIIYVPSCNGRGHVSWAICGSKDTFNKKRGKFEAMGRMFIDENKLPIGAIPETALPYYFEQLAASIY